MTPTADARPPGVRPVRRSDDFAAAFTLGLALRAAHLRAAAAYQTVLVPLGLELRHFAALIELTGDGPLSQSDLAARTGNDKVAMMRTVDHLQRAGLVTRGACPGDRRVRMVAVTARGEAVFEQAHLAARDVGLHLLDHLSSDERSVFTELLVRFVHRPEDAQTS